MTTPFDAIDDFHIISPAQRTHDGLSLKVWAFFNTGPTDLIIFERVHDLILRELDAQS